MVTVDFVCPACEHAPGRIDFDDNVTGACPQCQLQVYWGGDAKQIATLLLLPSSALELPSRLLGRRVGKPKRSKVGHALKGDELCIWRTFGLLTPWVNRYALSPTGFHARRRKASGELYPVASIRGFLPMQVIAGFTGEPPDATVMPCSVVVARDGDDVVYRPLFTHTREDAVYVCSLLNEHLERVRHAGTPYR
jgi:hypothetical protein